MTKQTLCQDCVHFEVCKYRNEFCDTREVAKIALDDLLNERRKFTISCTLFKNRNTGGTNK